MAVVIGWCTRTWRCLEALCSKGSFTEQDPGIAVLWAVLTVWRAVNPVLEEADADPVRFAGMRHLGG